jgi:hypothetical protein
MMRTVRSHAVRCCSARCCVTCSMVSCSACLTTSSTAPVVCVRMRIAPADPPVGLDDPPRLRNHLHLAFGARADLRRFPVEPVWVKALQQSAVPIPHLGIRRGGGNPEHLVPIHACACRPRSRDTRVCRSANYSSQARSVSKGSLVLSLLADAELSAATAVTATLQRSSKRDTDQPESRRPLSLGARSPRQKARSCSQTAPVARMVLCRPVPMIYLRLRTDATGACGTRDNRRNPV